MPYDINNMYGVLADPDLMGELKSRGGSKQFEKDIADDVTEKDKPAGKFTEAESHAQSIETELEQLVLLEANKGTNNSASTITGNDKAEQAVNHTASVSNPVATPATNCFHQQQPKHLDTTPHSPVSGKPSHRRRRDQEITTIDTSVNNPLPSPIPVQPSLSPSRPTHTEPPPRELFIFTNPRLYSHARALFATVAQPDHPTNLRWSNLAALLASPPISCYVVPARNGGSSVTVIRPARTVVQEERRSKEEKAGLEGKEGKEGKEGMERMERMEGKEEIVLEKRSVVLHRPHGGANAWVERHVLENMAGAMMARFGWEKGDFVFEGE